MFYDNDKNLLNLFPQSFSSIDLRTTPGNLGIVFPYDVNEDIKQTYCVSSIIDHHNIDTGYLIKHTEIRGVKTENKNLVYTKIHYATAYVIMENILSNSITQTFENCIQKDYTEDFCINTTNPSIQKKKEIYQKFQPLFFIDKENIKTKKYSYSFIGNSYEQELFNNGYKNNTDLWELNSGIKI